MHAAPASHFDRSVGALENAEIHNNRLTGQCLSGPEQPNKEDPVPQPALKLQKNCCAAIGFSKCGFPDAPLVAQQPARRRIGRRIHYGGAPRFVQVDTGVPQRRKGILSAEIRSAMSRMCPNRCLHIGFGNTVWRVSQQRTLGTNGSVFGSSSNIGRVHSLGERYCRSSALKTTC